MKKSTIDGPRTFAVVGLGSFGTTVATELERLGNHVIGVEQSETQVNSLASSITQAVMCDARDEDALRDAGLGSCDVGIVAIGEGLEASILASINLKMIGVPIVWAKASSKTHHRILSKLGVDRIIHPELEMGQHIAQVLHDPLVRDYMKLGNGFHVVNFQVPDNLEGKQLSGLNHKKKYEVRCLGVMRASEYIGQDGDDIQFEKNDTLLLLGRRKDLTRFAESL